MGDTLTTSIVLGTGEMGNAGVVVEVQGSSPGMRVTAGAGVAESALSNHWEPSSLEGGWDPRVTDSELLGVVCPGARTEVLSAAHDKSSCSSAVMLVAASQEYFAVRCMEEDGIEDVGGTKAMGTSSLGFMLKRLTCRSNGSWVGLSRVSMFQRGGSEKMNCMGSNSPFRPSGYTT